METARKLAIGVIMIIPAFVFGGMVWALLESWFAIVILEILMALLYTSIVLGWPITRYQKSWNG